MKTRRSGAAKAAILLSLVLGLGLIGDAQRADVTDSDVLLFAKNLMIPMGDGVKLATDIYRPARGGQPIAEKLPLLLQRTPYGKDGRGLVDQARAFARSGYIVALQDERGTGKSEGVQIKYIGQGRDGFDTVEELAKLPYADGQIGMWGTSYAAHAQASAAILNPPHLKAMVLNCGGLYNGWDHKIRNHGAFELAQQVGWAFAQVAGQTNNPAAAAAVRREKSVDWVGKLYARRGSNPLSEAPNFESYIFDMMTRADYDAYWKQPDVNWSLHYDETADVPMIHISGWYDPYAAGALHNYLGLSKIKKSAQRLLIGPWLHGRNTDSTAGDLEFGKDAALADFRDAFHLRWFDRFLKHASNGVDDDPPIRLFVMGTGDGHKEPSGKLFHGGYWKTSNVWPLPGTKPITYYLQRDGGLSPSVPGAGVPPSVYSYDPAHPVPTIGGSFTGQTGMVAAGGFDQREKAFDGDPDKGFFGSRPPYPPLKARPDVVVFETGPLSEDTQIIGPIDVVLFGASTAVDTDFTAKLIDVYPPSRDYPDGYDLNITDGILRARYRTSPEKPELMRSGEIYRCKVELFPTANVFKKGHRIRIDISSSNFPRFDPNPNTGEPLAKHTRIVVAKNSIYHDAMHPSHVVLPVVGQLGAKPRSTPTR
ncbi:MAG: CocE/NonD family hydrolase [Acidobacteria bacterium]|nr:CocE/NonD family hydrolase [Acidobacteriota bacterium]